MRAANQWMDVAEQLPQLVSFAMLAIALRLFIKLDTPSIPLTAAVLALGVGAGLLARGFGCCGK